jgi:hypothetical protein
VNVWALVTVAAGVLFLAGAGLYLSPALRRSVGDEELGDLPPTPLQRRARWVLALGLVWSAALGWIVVRNGPATMTQDRGERLLFTAVLLVGALGYLALMFLMRRGRAGEVAIDERDQQILARASEVRGALTLITVAVWAIVLTEAYWEAGAVPVAFLNLIFWSTFVVYLVAHAGGILLGYAMWRGDAEG